MHGVRSGSGAGSGAVGEGWQAQTRSTETHPTPSEETETRPGSRETQKPTAAHEKAAAAGAVHAEAGEEIDVMRGGDRVERTTN